MPGEVACTHYAVKLQHAYVASYTQARKYMRLTHVFRALTEPGTAAQLRGDHISHDQARALPCLIHLLHVQAGRAVSVFS